MSRAARSSLDVPTRLVEAAARLLAEEGTAAVSARRVTSEAGVSTMAVYTHFGNMEELLAQIWREGFSRFGVELERCGLTDDPVADWMAQGWSYRHFAGSQPHLYQVMFGPGLGRFKSGNEADQAAAMCTFESLLHHIGRCVSAGRFDVEDITMAGELVWSAVHGHALIELSGYYDSLGRDPATTFEALMVRSAIGFGDDAADARASLRAATARARRAGVIA